jgi:hypothetical protein
MSKKELIVKIPKKVQEHIKSVSENVIDVDFSSRFRYQDFSGSSIVIGSNPRPTSTNQFGDDLQILISEPEKVWIEKNCVPFSPSQKSTLTLCKNNDTSSNNDPESAG